MYLINDTYFQSPKYFIPNLEESDSKSFTELERLIDEVCRLFMQSILNDDELIDFESYLVDGIFPTDTTGIPQKWIDLINGKDDWKGVLQTNGTSKTSLLIDLVYYNWLIDNNTYMTSFGDAKANPKGASNVNVTQKMVNVWNEFVEKFQGDVIPTFNVHYNLCTKKTLIYFLEINKEMYLKENFEHYSFKNQLGI